MAAGSELLIPFVISGGSMIKLYQFALSGNSHKVRLMLSLLAAPFQTIEVSGAGREHKSAGFLELNPCGRFRCR